MKKKLSKLKKFLNKDIKEFNTVVLSLACIVFLCLVGFISYKINNSYAIFSDEIIGEKTIGAKVKKAEVSLNPDQSGANAPVLSSNMIPVYYDEENEVWKKADTTSTTNEQKWYNYDYKIWANSVTVSSTNRNTYKNANPGTTIPMEDILTMQVWIPRYKYKIFNYNANGETYVEEQQIDVVFEDGTETTGEVSCADSISGTNNAPSETCKLKSTNATCTDATCNNKYYTHPAFTFGEDELEGIWVGKFELTGTISNITTKPDLTSLRNQNISSFETNIMAMNDTSNRYGFSTNDDTHMMKNMEWGAVAYLTQSKYGMCDNGECSEVNKNNSSGYYTGRSGGSPNASSSANGTYRYNEKFRTETTITGGTEITPTLTNDATYPWTVTNGLYKSSTQDQDDTITNLTFTFTAPNNNTGLSFDWSVSSESASYDYLYYTIKKDGTTLSGTGTSTKIGGTSLGTSDANMTYKTVTKQLDAGEYTLTFTYKKDNSDKRGTDTGYIKNISIKRDATMITENIPIGVGQDGPSASTTQNIYGIYDMSGGAYEYTMSNIVSPDGITMISGIEDEYNDEIYTEYSGYTGKIYVVHSASYINYTGIAYPNSKYYDKYSFGHDYTQKTRAKLGDGIKEVGTSSNRSWYNDYAYLAHHYIPWFSRGGDEQITAGLFSSRDHNSDSGGGDAQISTSTRLVLSPINS